MKLYHYALPVLFLLTSCAGQRALYNQPDDPPGYAKAVLIHANAIGRQVAALRANPNVSDSSKSALLEGYRKLVCDAEELTVATSTAACRNGPSWQLDRAGRAYEQLANAETEADVQAAVNEATAVISEIIDIIAGAL